MNRFVTRAVRRVLARRRPDPRSLQPWMLFLSFLREPCYVCDGEPEYLPGGNNDWDCAVVACSDCECNLWVEALDSEPRKGA